MKPAGRLGLVFVIILCCIGCDQATKAVARATLASSGPISLWNDLIHLEYGQNSGAFLGLGASWPREARWLFFLLVPAVSLLLTLAYIARVRDAELTPVVGLSLLAGGGISNLIDRVVNNGAVADFVRLGGRVLHTGVFNMADVAIVAGAIVLFWWSVRESRHTPQNDA
jgi:signal peptidase II